MLNCFVNGKCSKSGGRDKATTANHQTMTKMTKNTKTQTRMRSMARWAQLCQISKRKWAKMGIGCPMSRVLIHTQSRAWKTKKGSQGGRGLNNTKEPEVIRLKTTCKRIKMNLFNMAGSWIHSCKLKRRTSHRRRLRPSEIVLRKGAATRNPPTPTPASPTHPIASTATRFQRRMKDGRILKWSPKCSVSKK